MKKWKKRFARGDRVRSTDDRFGDGTGTVIGTWTEGLRGSDIGGWLVLFDDHPNAGSPNYSIQVTSAAQVDINSIEPI